MNWIDRVLMRVIRFFVITNQIGDPYMVRYKLFRCPWFKVFLHHILRSDEDPELHCHPWNFVSIMLWKGYFEILPSGGRVVRAGEVVRHRATDAHRLILDEPAWTLVFVTGKKRIWGFYTADGWMSWTDFLDRKYGKGNWISE
jgi:hypothetical protein